MQAARARGARLSRACCGSSAAPSPGARGATRRSPSWSRWRRPATSTRGSPSPSPTPRSAASATPSSSSTRCSPSTPRTPRPGRSSPSSSCASATGRRRATTRGTPSPCTPSRPRAGRPRGGVFQLGDVPGALDAWGRAVELEPAAVGRAVEPRAAGGHTAGPTSPANRSGVSSPRRRATATPGRGACALAARAARQRAARRGESWPRRSALRERRATPRPALGAGASSSPCSGCRGPATAGGSAPRWC